MFQVEVNTINQVLQYLSSRPYAEVAGLINAIQAGQEVEEKVEEGKSNEE